MKTRNELSNSAILGSIQAVQSKIEVRLIDKGRGAYIGSHETYGILAEEFKELLDALQADNVMGFYDELLDIAVGAIIGMASVGSLPKGN